MSQLPLTRNEKEVIHKVHNMPESVTFEQTRQVFSNFLLVLLLDFLSEDSTYLPYVGDIDIQYLEDEIINGEAEAKLNIEIKPTEFFKKIIGQLVDDDSSCISDSLINDIEDLFKQHLENTLKEETIDN